MAMQVLGRSTQNINLTDVESNLRRLLLDAARHVPQNPPGSEKHTTLRFTGGWVRDKLLGQQSHDVDVSIDTMTGLEFGLRLQEYLAVPGNAEKYGDNKTVCGSLHTIAANPEKSKHLETVTTKILGLDIDLVNLRKETYTDDSRNPEMEFGTPEEDALRRDATVNALFYNLDTERVEDFTGRGLQDLQGGVIRTPLLPLQTFREDPLRVLRLVRFASRLGFTIDSDVEECMKDVSIKDALRRKISRERVGVELEKMLRGPSPLTAITIIHRVGLWETVFVDTSIQINDFPDARDLSDIAMSLQSLFDSTTDQAAQLLVLDKDDTYHAWLLACLVPYRDQVMTETAIPGKKLPLPRATDVVREGIKGTLKTCNLVTSAMRNRASIADMVSAYRKDIRQSARQPDLLPQLSRDTIGMAIRRWGETWRLQTLFALLADIADEPSSSAAIIRDYSSFVKHVEDLGLLDAYAIKPIIDGKTLAKAMSTKPGPWMKDALDVVMAWQLRNPGKSDTTEVIDQIRESKNIDGELLSDLVTHILGLTIRPLFAKAHNPAITPQARRVTTTVLPQKLLQMEADSITKPWKDDVHALDLLDWVTRHLTQELIEKNWTLIIPPVLSIVDDTEIVYKVRGCVMLTRSLEVTPTSLLTRTGLVQVFQEALMPCLSFLPTLTPVDDSVKMLDAAYPALFSLCHAAFPLPATSQVSSSSTDPKMKDASVRRVKFLDEMLRKGIFFAYDNCPTAHRIVEVLFRNLSILISELGIESVRHIRFILPMLNEVLCHPFAMRYTPLLLAAVKALQTLILNAWPRMAANRGEVLRGLCLCWRRMIDEGETDTELQTEMRRAVQMLRDAVRSECDLDAELAVLVQADAEISGLVASA